MNTQMSLSKIITRSDSFITPFDNGFQIKIHFTYFPTFHFAIFWVEIPIHYKYNRNYSVISVFPRWLVITRGSILVMRISVYWRVSFRIGNITSLIECTGRLLTATWFINVNKACYKKLKTVYLCCFHNLGPFLGRVVINVSVHTWIK
jgi:hypothetical protein